MMTSQTIESLLIHVKLQAIIHNVEETIALDYVWLNLGRNTGQISRQDYHEIFWEMTAEIATTQELWENHLDFATIVTSLINEYVVEYWAEYDNFIDFFELQE